MRWGRKQPKTCHLFFSFPFQVEMGRLYKLFDFWSASCLIHFPVYFVEFGPRVHAVSIALAWFSVFHFLLKCASDLLCRGLCSCALLLLLMLFACLLVKLCWFVGLFVGWLDFCSFVRVPVTVVVLLLLLCCSVLMFLLLSLVCRSSCSTDLVVGVVLTIRALGVLVLGPHMLAHLRGKYSKGGTWVAMVNSLPAPWLIA